MSWCSLPCHRDASQSPSLTAAAAAADDDAAAVRGLV